MKDFRAKTAAHIGGNDAQFMLWNAQHKRTHQQTDNMGILRRGVKRVVAGAAGIVTYGDARLHRVGD